MGDDRLDERGPDPDGRPVTSGHGTAKPSRVLLSLASRLYPARFRRDFGVDWRGFVTEQRQEPRYASWLYGSMRYWKDVFLDAAVSGLRMRWFDGAVAGAGNRVGGRGGEHRSSAEGGWPGGGRGRPGGPSYWDEVRSDVRYTVRSLRRNPGFTAVVVATLGVAIGATVAVLAVYESVMLRPLPFEDPDRVVELNEDPPFDNMRWQITAANLIDWRERTSVFEDIAAISQVLMQQANLTGIGEPLRVPLARVSPSLFDILGVEAELGRTLLPDDDDPSATPVVVISHGLWIESFGGSRDVLGRTVRVAGEPHTVVGVMPPEFGVGVAGGPRFLWLPQALPPRVTGDRRQRMFRAIARLRPGVTVAQADAQLSALALALAEEHPEANQWDGESWDAQVATVRERMVEITIRPSLVVLSGGVAIVLLIAWLNVANLMVARTVARRRELAVRSAIGAGRGRVARQLLTEASVIALLGAVAGVGLARWLMRIFTEVVVGDFPFLSDTSITGWVLLMTVATTLVTALVCGLAPALGTASRRSAEALRIGRGNDQRRGQIGQILVALEVSLALVLLIGMGLMVDTMARITSIPVGFDPTNLEAMGAELDAETYIEPMGQGQAAIRPELDVFVSTVRDGLAALPGIEAAAVTTSVPLTLGLGAAPIHFQGQERAAPPRMQPIDGVAVHDYASLSKVGAGYFDVMRIPLLRGRALGHDDGLVTPVAAVVNEAFIEEYALEQAIGTELLIRDGPSWHAAEIVGVVGDVLRMYPRYPFAARFTGVQPVLYVPISWRSSTYTPRQARGQMSVSFMVRHGGGGDALRGAMRDVMRQADTQSPIVAMTSMDELAAENLADRRAHMRLIVCLALISVFLALVGVYGVVSFQVGRRIHEIGVRMALGAAESGVVRMIVGEGSRVAVAGALLGVVGARASTHFLSNWLYEVSPTDASVFLTASVAIVGVTVLACWIPARRAAAVDPVESLRVE